ncbi:MAG TPA: RluA family pseudouridine synthase [Flavobacteriales bacterium]|nr:RluA family pseudouridine synthase [Flavobacteriales bacterium]HRE96287.1 RluA family pseudouridine synthase [Flavobacteriales bacterium]HRJ35337.1 RluA family pseudouridine synthase [Flavobacteriales bacterium]HRJ39041.1 RluA family pseudouridine synthase [Flavobacteriales bacterium]
MELQVIFEDNHLIAVNKQSGDIVQGDKTGDVPLSEVIKEYLKAKYNKPGNVFCGVIHRIDRPVTGVVLFAKTSKALSRMSEQFRDKQVKKTYWAIVKNKPASEKGNLVHYLLKDERTNKSKAFSKEVKDAKFSELNFKLIASGERYHLLEVDPLTGRHHQIRAQLSAMGCPIKGDLKYGSERSNPDGSISLHARRIEFVHPVTGEQQIIEATVPDDRLWKDLEKMASAG